MTQEYAFPTQQEAYNFACMELQTDPYRGWGWASVFKHEGKWIASIA